MKSTAFCIIFSAILVGIGWLIGGIFTPVLTGAGVIYHWRKHHDREA